MYLDEERSNATCTHCGQPLSIRDEGDGSSSSTNADEASQSLSQLPSPTASTVPLPAPPPPASQASLPTPQAQNGSQFPLTRSSSRELLQEALNGQRSNFNGMYFLTFFIYYIYKLNKICSLI